MPYRRDYKRFILNDSAALVIREGLEKSVLLKDLSVRGIGIVADRPLVISEKITVVINAPFFFGKLISREAAVVWCKKMDSELWRAGLDFGLDNKVEILPYQ